MTLERVVERFRRFLRPPRRAVPTRAGLFALGAPIVLGLAAVNAGNNLLFLLLGGVLGAIVLSGILSERNIRGVEVDLRPVAPAYAGEPARLQVVFRRPGARAGDTPAYGLRVIERTSRSLWSFLRARPRPELLDVTLMILEGESGSRLGVRTFNSRGPAVLGPAELTTRYPFALLEKLRDLDLTLDLLVRPRRIPVPAELADPRGLAADGEESARRGVGLEVYGLREREDRDGESRLHALRSLSLGRDVVIETSGIERPIAWLGVANVEGADPAAFEHALELAQATLTSWEERGFAPGLATAERAFEPASTGLPVLLDALAGATLCPRYERVEGRAALWIVPQGATPPPGARAIARVGSSGSLVLSRVEAAA